MFFLVVIGLIGLCSLTSAQSDFWNGVVYHATSSPQYTTALAILKDTQFNGNDHILDIGCGAGDVTAYLAQHVPNGFVMGIDSSASMIDFAQKTHGSLRCQFKQEAAQEFVFEEQSFNCVTSFSCLHWVKDLKQVLTRIKRVLKPGGKFVGNMAHTGHFFYEPVIATLRSEKWQEYFKDFQEEPWYAQNSKSFAELLNEVELKPLKLTEWGKRASFSSKEQFSAFIKNWIYAIPHMARLPVEKQEEFVDNAIACFLKNINYEADGSFCFNATVFSFEVIKQ